MIAIFDSRNLDAVKNAVDWRDAANDLIAFWTAEGRCYTSGEIAAALRTHRPDLRFAVSSVGAHVRELFYNQALPSYVDASYGTPVTAYPFQELRVCSGLWPDRTPAGTEVYVYGPNQADVQAAEFEVYIPKPGETIADAPAPDPNADPTLDGPQAFAATVKSRQYVARVWPDARLAVPRRALEAAAKLAGVPLQGGAPIFVKQTAAEAVVSLADPNDPDFKAYTVTRSDARVAFHSVNGPFVPGSAYGVLIDAGKVVIDLSATVVPSAAALTD